MQCDRIVGECWCVNKMGNELFGICIRGNKQYCDVFGRVYFNLMRINDQSQIREKKI